MKKRIAFLYSGQIRSNSLSDVSNNDSSILDSWLLHLFNNDLKNKYDFDIFISTNTLDIERTKTFFGENNIKNIHFIESDYYLKKIDNYIPTFEFLKNIHLQQIHPSEKHWIKPHTMWQSYRMYDVYNLYANYVKATGQEYDLICRFRLDTPFKQSMVFAFDQVANSEVLKAITFSDIFTVGKPDIMEHYMTSIENKFLHYNEIIDLNDWNYFIYTKKQHYEKANDRWWKYSAEKQSTECFLEYCRNNNLNPNEVLKGIETWEHYVTIYQRHRFEN